MQHHTHTALFTTVSGVVGDVGKAISAEPLWLAISLPGLTTVIIYASASAVAVYVVKENLYSA
jgi:hypothetical protein